MHILFVASFEIKISIPQEAGVSSLITLEIDTTIEMLNKVLSDKIKCEYYVKRCFGVFGIRATISKVKQLNT